MGTHDVISIPLVIAVFLFPSPGLGKDTNEQEHFKRGTQGKMTVQQNMLLKSKIAHGEIDALIAIRNQWVNPKSQRGFFGFLPSTEDDHVIDFLDHVASELKDWKSRKWGMHFHGTDSATAKAILKWCKDIVRAHSHSSYAHFFLGRAYSTFGPDKIGLSYEERFDSALHHYQEAIRYNEKLGLAYFFLASEHQRRSIVLSFSVPATGDKPGDRYKLGDGQLIEYYKRAAALDPSLNDDVNRSLGEIYWGSKSYDNALFYLMKVLHIKPTSADVHYKIGKSYLEKGDINEAIKFLTKASDLDPSPQYYDDLAAAYEDAGKYQAAVGIQQKHLSVATESEIDNVKKEIASLEETLTGSKASAKEIEGVWVYISFESNQKLPDEWEAALKEGRFTTRIKGDAFTTRIGGKVVFRGTQKLDTSKKPKAINAAGTKGEVEGKTMLGIYEVNGDTLKICFNTPGNERPSEFNVAPGSAQFMVTAKRGKK